MIQRSAVYSTTFPRHLRNQAHAGSITAALLLMLSWLLVVAGCGSNGGDSTATPTPTPTTAGNPPTATRTSAPPSSPPATPTRVSTANDTLRVSGLVVINRNVISGAGDVVGLPPERWMQEEGATEFDRALAHADWEVAGQELNGSTGPDGQFEIVGLEPGRYDLQLTKTLNGNLLSFTVPFTAAAGEAEVVAEVSWGLVRSATTYSDDGVEVQVIRGPYGNYVVTRGGQVSELGDASITLNDDDLDGRFDVVPCIDSLWLCDDQRACGEGRACGCTSSCPFCEDCRTNVCAPPNLSPSPYQCGADNGCAQPGDRCICVSSCPECDDCALSVCVPNCEDVEIDEIIISAPTELVSGQQSNATAVGVLSDGRHVDVTTLVDWTSSNEGVATVSSFGALNALAIGTTTLSATLGTLTTSHALAVVGRPTLRRIYVQNVGCYYPLGQSPETDGTTRPPVLDGQARDDFWAPPCGQVVEIGRTIQFTATGEFGDGFYYDDITDEVTWQLNPAGIGSIDGGLFTAEAAGTTQLTASLEGVASDPSEIRVVTEASVISVSIYANQGGIEDGFIRPVPVADPPTGAAAGGIVDPCIECGYTLTVLRGDELQFYATAHFDTGEWRDVSDSVEWRTSVPSVATIDQDGTALAIIAGTAVIDATLESVTSNPVTLQVVNEATLTYIYAYPEGNDRVVVKGGDVFFHAFGNYDIGFQRDVTADVTWRSSNDSVGGFDDPAVFTGRTAGTTQVWAEVGAVRSEPTTLEVYETSDITYCDPDDVNRGMWSDDFNRVVLESDCAEYSPPAVVTLRYTVTETQLHGGIFDPCLDLYIYRGDERIRTLREEGCGEPFLNRGAPEFADAVLRYQLRAFWDLKDESGQLVTPGAYTVFGRFFLYYDPVVSIDVTVR